MQRANGNTHFQDGHEGHHPRKRKLDKDGFVCPTTPDIPRNSHHYVEDEQHGNFKSLGAQSNFTTFAGDFEQADSASVSTYFKAKEDNVNIKMIKNNSTYRQGADNSSFEQAANSHSLEMGNNQNADGQTENDSSQGQISRQDSLGFKIEEDSDQSQEPGEATNVYDSYNSEFDEEKRRLKYGTKSDQPNEEGAASQMGINNILQSLVKGFEQESSAMFDTWSKTFGQCGEYEVLCQQRLDGMIQNARSMEDSLNGKKDALCNRLKGIGKTLET